MHLSVFCVSWLMIVSAKLLCRFCARGKNDYMDPGSLATCPL